MVGVYGYNIIMVIVTIIVIVIVIVIVIILQLRALKSFSKIMAIFLNSHYNDRD